MRAILCILVVAASSSTSADEKHSIVISPARSKSSSSQPSVASASNLSALPSEYVDHINAMSRAAGSMSRFAAKYSQHPMHGADAVQNHARRLHSMIGRNYGRYEEIVAQYEKTLRAYRQWQQRDSNHKVVGRGASILRRP